MKTKENRVYFCYYGTSDHLEDFLAAPKDQTTSSTLIINYYHGFREGLEILTFSAPTNNLCRGHREEQETLNSSTPTNNHYCGFRERLDT